MTLLGFGVPCSTIPTSSHLPQPWGLAGVPGGRGPRGLWGSGRRGAGKTCEAQAPPPLRRRVCSCCCIYVLFCITGTFHVYCFQISRYVALCPHCKNGIYGSHALLNPLQTWAALALALSLLALPRGGWGPASDGWPCLHSTNMS